MPDPLLSDDDLMRVFHGARDRLMWSGRSNARDAMLAGLRAVESAVLERSAPMMADFRRAACSWQEFRSASQGAPMADPDGRTHSPVCWRGHEDCAEQLLSEAAEALDAVLDELQRSTDPRPSTWPAIAKAERDVLVRLRAALEG